jgi:hypothetical protein
VAEFHCCSGLVFIIVCFVAHYLYETDDRAVAQAVSRWLPTSAARIRVRTAYGFCDGQSGTVAGFLGAVLFPLLIIISPIFPP